MEMIDRYLHAIEFWLPRAHKKDILAEISEDIHSQIEDEQAELGRSLNESEMEALLKQRGRPMLVANRFRPQQSLIGPMWFPTYIAILKVVAFGYVPLWMLVYVIVRRVQNAGESWGMTIFASWPMFWTVAFVTTGVVTLIFASLQFAESKTHFLENWNPRELPRVQDPNQISRGHSIAEVAVSIAFLLWWMAYASSPVLFDGPAFKLTLAPVRVYFFWGYLVVGLFNMAFAAFNLRWPNWTPLRATLRLCSDLVGGALFCWLMKANILASIYFANVEPGHALVLRDQIQTWLGRSFPFAVIVVAIIAATDGYRILRVSGKSRVHLFAGVIA
jgi:hypothetical protein